MIKNKKLGIVIGHSMKSQGAYNRGLGVSEYSLNAELAAHVKAECDKRNITSEIIHRLNGYAKLPSDINKKQLDYCISIHHNATEDKTVNGTETLCYHKSKTSLKFAYAVNKEMVLSLNTRNRGVKKVDSEDRGGYILKYTSAPCILIEPYFISNTDAVKNRNVKKLSSAIVDGYENFLNSLKTEEEKCPDCKGIGEFEQSAGSHSCFVDCKKCRGSGIIKI